jgi:hypothetical protein
MVVHHIMTDKPLIEGNENESIKCLVGEGETPGIKISPQWFGHYVKNKCECPKSEKEGHIFNLQKHESLNLWRCSEKPLNQNDCKDFKKEDRIYDVSDVNKCLNHLGGGQIYSKTDASGDPIIDPEPISAFEFNKNDNAERDNDLHVYCHERGIKAYNDLCETFGHKTLNEKFIKDQADSNTYNNKQGYFPNRKTCSIRDTNNEFIKQVGMSNGHGHKQTLKIKCDN